MTQKHTSRHANIFQNPSVRRRIWTGARGRSQANFGVHLSGGPYGGITLLEEGATHHHDNGDEAALGGAGNFSKGLTHAPNGLAAGYAAFAAALETARADMALPDMRLDSAPVTGALEAALLAASSPNRARRFVNPLAGLATDPLGLDPYGVTMPPAPALGSEVAAAEMVELYWMALMRDVPFDDWSTHPLALDAQVELNTLNLGLATPFAEHWDEGTQGFTRTITPGRLFRGSAPEGDRGGYVSRFLLDDVTFGTLRFPQVQRNPAEGQDFMTTWPAWLQVQNGAAHPGWPAAPGLADMETGPTRRITTLRDLAHYVHYDALHEAYFNAALILLDAGAPASEVNVYRSTLSAQQGFGTFGGPQVLTLLTEVSTRALKAVWHQKWFVHRRLRPEAMGGRIEALDAGLLMPTDVPVHALAMNSQALDRVRTKHGTALLPMAFPEGSPMHPSYGAGHGTVAGACVTVLKALFDPTATLARPGWEGLTVGGELDKLAANIAIGRNAAGVHYRSEYTKSLALGEAVAIAILQEHARTTVESDGSAPVWRLRRFDGAWIDIAADGSIAPHAPVAGPQPQPTV